ncbi:MAG: hypothetical protein ACREBS_03615 [Nitrososphaerales archaeon]
MITPVKISSPAMKYNIGTNCGIKTVWEMKYAKTPPKTMTIIEIIRSKALILS